MHFHGTWRLCRNSLSGQTGALGRGGCADTTQKVLARFGQSDQIDRVAKGGNPFQQTIREIVVSEKKSTWRFHAVQLCIIFNLFEDLQSKKRAKLPMTSYCGIEQIARKDEANQLVQKKSRENSRLWFCTKSSTKQRHPLQSIL